MFSNKWNQVKISNRNQKILKFNYKLNLLKKNLNNNQFTLFYYYDSWSAEINTSLKEVLVSENLQYSRIKKNILNNSEYQFLKDLVKNNVIIITSNTNSEFLNKYLTKLNNIKNIHFIGIFFKKTFLRPFEIKKIVNLNTKSLNVTTSKTLKLNFYLLKKALSLKKF